MELSQLEQKKIALTKELEKVQEEINYYGLDMIAHDAWPFKELIIKRDGIKYEIESIKKLLNSNI